MSLHGPSVDVETPGVERTGDAPRAAPAGPVGLLQVDEPLGRIDTTEFRPAGTGGEFTTSTQSAQLVATVEPDRDGVLLLDEVSLSIDSEGQATVDVGQQEYGPYTGADDVSLPFDGTVLPFGRRIRVFHQSTAGNSTTTKVSVTGREI